MFNYTILFFVPNAKFIFYAIVLNISFFFERNFSLVFNVAYNFINYDFCTQTTQEKLTNKNESKTG